MLSKLYQFYPDKINVPAITTILLKSLINLPNTNFLFASGHITEKVVC